MPDKGYNYPQGKDLLRILKRRYKKGELTFKQYMLLLHKHNLK